MANKLGELKYEVSLDLSIARFMQIIKQDQLGFVFREQVHQLWFFSFHFRRTDVIRTFDMEIKLFIIEYN